MEPARISLRDQIPSVSGTLLSVVTPAYNESANLPGLYQRLSDVLLKAGISWEWIVVDDHSSDTTFQVLKELAERDPRVRALRFSRNCGSHIAILCGLQAARGQCAAILAADFQDPPELLEQFLERWNSGAQVVWAVRSRRLGETRRRSMASGIYHRLMRRVVGEAVPATGADFFLLDRRVIDAILVFPESNTSLMVLVAWMGFRQESITYEKQARLSGQSGWTLRKKVKLAVDSVTSFSYFPVRTMSYVGFTVAIVGFAYATAVLTNAITGRPVAGWSSLMIVVLVLGGVQMLMMGVLGEYLWRTLEESRRRPRYIVEETTPSFSPANERHSDQGR